MQFAAEFTRLGRNIIEVTSVQMEPQSFLSDKKDSLSRSQHIERALIICRSHGHILRNAVVTLAVLAMYLTFPIRAQKSNLQAPTCNAKDLKVLSCSPKSTLTNSCCVENPAGLLLQAQLYNPQLSHADAWTIHGLWGDFCNGRSSVNYTDDDDADRSRFVPSIM